MLFILVVLDLTVFNIGFPKEIDDILDGTIITEAGEQISCKVQLNGETTDYLFKEAEYSWTDHVSVSVNGQFIAEVSYDTGNDIYTFARNQIATVIMHRSRDLLLAELDVQKLFPEMESVRCILVMPAENIESLSDILDDGDIPEICREAFQWAKGL